MGYGALRYLSNGDLRQQLGALPQAEINFLYQGQRRHTAAGSAPFDLVRGPLGALHSPRTHLNYLLSLNSWIEDDCLHMDWAYSDRLYDRDTVERLSQAFLHHLRSLIVACRKTGIADWSGGATEFDWDSSEVENITAAIKKTLGSS
jgi:non-ribosomal peptide synthase protein (TIGR01720 family)